MNIPLSYTVKHHIGSYLHRKPNCTFDEIKAGMLGRRASLIKALVEAMTEDGLIIKTGDTYALSIRFADYFDQLAASTPEAEPVVPPRTAPEFRPLSAKYMLPKIPPRDDALPLREIAFKTGSIGFYTGYRA